MTVLSPLYVICDADVCAAAGWPLLDYAKACLDGGATLLQVRAKSLAAQPLLEVTQAIVDLATAHAALVIVNDRADVALAAGAGGVHVGQEDLPPSAVRPLVGAAAVIGFSTHSDEQLTAALTQPIDYVAIGPVFGTATKDTGYGARGLEMVRQVAARTQPPGLPLVGIGGITLERAPSVIDAGAQSVAVISDLLATRDPAGRVRAFLQALQ